MESDDEDDCILDPCFDEVGGYEDSRFQSSVPRHLHCAICLSVLKQPMQCENNEHSFCKSCIHRHLRVKPRCPICMDPLTQQTLRRSRLASDLLSEFKISCENAVRGCKEFVELGLLKAHVASCGYTQVKCFNFGCKEIINRRAKTNHEKNECEFRLVECQECGKKVNYRKRKLHCYALTEEVVEVKKNIKETKEELLNVRQVVKDLGNDVKLHMDQVKNCMDYMKREIALMKGPKESPSVTQELQSKEVNDDTQNKEPEGSPSETPQPTSNKQVHVKGLEGRYHLTRKLEQSQGSFTFSPCFLRRHFPHEREDFIVAGGNGLLGGTKSVEMYNWKTHNWTSLPAMQQEHYHSSSFVYQDKMFVCGGIGREHDGDIIEVLQFTDNGPEWAEFPVKLPHKVCGHSSTVYNDSVFIIGGGNGNATRHIYKMSLLPPYGAQLVCLLPEPRMNHGAQRFDDKIIIVGGTSTGHSYDCLASVLVYDITNNCCNSLAALPYPVENCATVAWKDNIIVIGGWGGFKKLLRTVLMYNVTNETSELLPPLKKTRTWCSAVITGDVMVVMGGYSATEYTQDEAMSSVVCFDFNTYTWQNLADLKERRYLSTTFLKS